MRIYPRTLSTKFQSTLSVRRATLDDAGVVAAGIISIHALRKESDPASRRQSSIRMISIHALRKESDHQVLAAVGHGEISIHALRKESDNIQFEHRIAWRHFNPRSP